MAWYIIAEGQNVDLSSDVCEVETRGTPKWGGGRNPIHSDLSLGYFKN